MNYNYTTLPILNSVIAGGHVVTLVKQGNMLSIAMFNKELKAKSEIVTLNGSKGFILDAKEDKLLLSIDNKLILIEDGKWRTVLKSERSENFFWHAARVGIKVLSSTGIFVSEDLQMQIYL
jgi:hypothetical protein